MESPLANYSDENNVVNTMVNDVLKEVGYYDQSLETQQQDCDDDEELQQVLEEVGYPDFYNIDPFKEVRSMNYNDVKDESNDDIVGPLATIELVRDTGDDFPEYMDD